MNRVEQLRGPGPGKRHNARTVAALTGNPGCTRRAVLDAAGVDKVGLAERIGFPGGFGQSRFALARGNAFEAMLKADDCALLRATLGAYVGTYEDLGVDEDGTLSARHARTRTLLEGFTEGLVDHPLLTLDVAGQTVFLEPDLIAYQTGTQLQVVEIKSFAIIDGQADGTAVSAAAVQAAVYVLALRRLLGDDKVSHEVVLVCPENFSLQPVAVVLDVRKQLSTLRRQLSRLESVSVLLETLPDGLTFDLAQPVPALVTALETVDARYAPECLSACELSVFCRHEAGGRTSTLGRPVREALGGVETIDEALALASGAADPAPDQTEAAALLRAALRLRDEALLSGPSSALSGPSSAESSAPSSGDPSSAGSSSVSGAGPR
ncbi:hypothetical protein [Paractinoplanes bogorensis]|uniref:hypothetical protein n=1 Tax=Paractinoplanes bogorensis TaxID=1610840 RepID=UPI0027DF6DDB|nr:hypothetical protein [Actinoplanes bogorensis]